MVKIALVRKAKYFNKTNTFKNLQKISINRFAKASGKAKRGRGVCFALRGANACR